MAALTYGDLASKTYGDLQNLTYSFEDGGSSSGGGESETTSLSSEDINAIATAVWGYATKVVSVTGVAQESTLSSLSTLLQTIIALLADFSVSDNTLTITVNNTNKTYTITKSDGSITSVHPTQQQ